MARTGKKELPSRTNRDFIRGVIWENSRLICLNFLTSKKNIIRPNNRKKIARLYANAVLAVYDANPKKQKEIAAKIAARALKQIDVIIATSKKAAR